VEKYCAHAETIFLFIIKIDDASIGVEGKNLSTTDASAGYTDRKIKYKSNLD
jgi:hypothetical protein